MKKKEKKEEKGIRVAWDRQLGESEEQHEAFLYYVCLEKEYRSVYQAFENWKMANAGLLDASDLDSDAEIWVEWCKEFKWAERAEAKDQYNAAQKTKEFLSTVRKRTNDNLLIIAWMKKLGTDILKAHRVDLETIPPSLAVALLRSAMKEERDCLEFASIAGLQDEDQQQMESFKLTDEESGEAVEIH